MQGAGQSSFITAWGDGFVTDPAILSANGLSDPRPFFDTLATKPYLGRVSALPTASAGKVVSTPATLNVWGVHLLVEEKTRHAELARHIPSFWGCNCQKHPCYLSRTAASSGSAACAQYWPYCCSDRICRTAS